MIEAILRQQGTVPACSEELMMSVIKGQRVGRPSVQLNYHRCIQSSEGGKTMLEGQQQQEQCPEADVSVQWWSQVPGAADGWSPLSLGKSPRTWNSDQGHLRSQGH